MSVVNKIVFVENGKILKDIIKEGNSKYFIFDDGEKVKYSDISHKIRVCCVLCGKFKKEIKLYNGKHSPLNKKCICFSCCVTGENNPFYGKKHTDETKQKIRDANGCMSGESNPFYGKKHTDETKQKIRDSLPDMSGENNPFYGKKHTDETKQKIKIGNDIWVANRTDEYKKMASIKTSEAQKAAQLRDPEYYVSIKRKAGRISHSAQFKNYKMNKVEKSVYDKIGELGIDMSFSVLFCRKQFDFGNKKNKILLEVHGDYWHGNPMLYSESATEGKKKLNCTQNKKILADIEKKRIAEKYGFKIFYIWEMEVLKGDFRVLHIIKDIIDNANKI